MLENLFDEESLLRLFPCSRDSHGLRRGLIFVELIGAEINDVELPLMSFSPLSLHLLVLHFLSPVLLAYLQSRMISGLESIFRSQWIQTSFLLQDFDCVRLRALDVSGVEIVTLLPFFSSGHFE